MPNRRSGRDEALRGASRKALTRYCDEIRAAKGFPDYVLHGLLDTMAGLSPESIAAWEKEQRRRRPVEHKKRLPKKSVEVKFEWREPPTINYARGRNWLAILAPCLENPGRWARIANNERPSAVQGLKPQARKVYPSDDWEMMTKVEEDGTSSFYVRYCPKEGDADRVRGN